MTLNKRKVSTPYSETDNPTQETQELENGSNFDSATKTRAISRNSHLNKSLQKGLK